MDFPLYYLLPLLSGFLYPIGSLFFKQAIDQKVGAMRLAFFSNLATALSFLVLLFFNTDTPQWDFAIWPILAGITFFLGQILTVAALRVGDVSVQAPLMGTKTVFVALTSVAFQPDNLPLTWWLGAAVTALAVFLMGSSDRGTFSRSLPCVLLSLIAAAFYGLTDTLVAAKSPDFGRFPFVIVMTQSMALLSLGMIPFFKQSLRTIPRSAWIPMLAGSAAMATQAIVLGIALSLFGRATPMNILYSSRGIWGILLVWFAGHYFANMERSDVGSATMRRRFAGAALLCLAIVLVFV